MEYKIEEQSDCHSIVIIDLPVEISKVSYSYEYYDHDLKRMRSTHPNYWGVNECDLTPIHMVVEVKEFKEVDNAIAHAKMIYLKYLRQELDRVRHDEEGK